MSRNSDIYTILFSQKSATFVVLGLFYLSLFQMYAMQSEIDDLELENLVGFENLAVVGKNVSLCSNKYTLNSKSTCNSNRSTPIAQYSRSVSKELLKSNSGHQRPGPGVCSRHTTPIFFTDLVLKSRPSSNQSNMSDSVWHEVGGLSSRATSAGSTQTFLATLSRPGSGYKLPGPGIPTPSPINSEQSVFQLSALNSLQTQLNSKSTSHKEQSILDEKRKLHSLLFIAIDSVNELERSKIDRLDGWQKYKTK